MSGWSQVTGGNKTCVIFQPGRNKKLEVGKSWRRRIKCPSVDSCSRKLKNRNNIILSSCLQKTFPSFPMMTSSSQFLLQFENLKFNYQTSR